MHLLSKIFIRLTAKYIGKDEFGNKYYEKSSNKVHYGRKDRLVIYSGMVEGSKVPPGWFAWLHHQTDKKPSNKPIYKWQKEYKPNASGTSSAYFPPGHINSGGARARSTGDYYAWKPTN